MSSREAVKRLHRMSYGNVKQAAIITSFPFIIFILSKKWKAQSGQLLVCVCVFFLNESWHKPL